MIYLTKKDKENIHVFLDGVEIVPQNRELTLKFVRKVLLYLRDTTKLPEDKYILLDSSYNLDGLQETNTGLIMDSSVLYNRYTDESINIIN